jgi:hypothetical protein
MLTNSVNIGTSELSLVAFGPVSRSCEKVDEGLLGARLEIKEGTIRITAQPQHRRERRLCLDSRPP